MESGDLKAVSTWSELECIGDAGNGPPSSFAITSALPSYGHCKLVLVNATFRALIPRIRTPDVQAIELFELPNEIPMAKRSVGAVATPSLSSPLIA